MPNWWIPKPKNGFPTDEEGVTVYTHLERTSQPMIRFWAGDISRWTLDPCPCGRTYPRLPRGVYGRADDMFVVRGENVYPSAIENAIRSIDGFGDEFRIVITREKTMDELIVQAEPVPGTDRESVLKAGEKAGIGSENQRAADPGADAVAPGILGKNGIQSQENHRPKRPL
jgi:phenylacetate-coenzyme A ligase PaaK-like adenylate-forming protein